jgi:pimeloyl-ACP methyl ester carboxylesterase
MPYFRNDGADIYYDDVGSGPLVIATHGMMSPGYWVISGVSGMLGMAYRVVSLDMRGHGRTRVAEGAAKYDVDTLAGDIGALADHLGADRFHLLSHATGGMVALRYAMANHERLLSLIAISTTSQTAPMSREVFVKQAGIIRATNAGSIYDMMVGSHAGVFLARLAALPDAKRLRVQTELMFRANDPNELADFMLEFFQDPDPRTERLEQISCPTLALVGEHDQPFLQSSRLIADHVPKGEYMELKDIGHMTAFEDGLTTFRVVQDFLEEAGRS